MWLLSKKPSLELHDAVSTRVVKRIGKCCTNLARKCFKQQRV